MAVDLTPSELKALRFIVSEVEAGTVSDDDITVGADFDGTYIGTGHKGKTAPFTLSTIEALDRAGAISISKREKNFYIFSLRPDARRALVQAEIEGRRAFRDEVLRVIYREAKGTTRNVEVERIAEALERTERDVSDVLKVLEGAGFVATMGSEGGVIASSLTPPGIDRVESLVTEPQADAGTGTSARSPQPAPYIAERRINELRSMRSDEFDLRRLVQMCEELNLAAANESYIAMGALQRTIIHHVPPVFRAKNFETVVAQAPKGSFKRHMEHLLGSLKNVADQVLHVQAGKSSSPVELPDVNCGLAINELIQKVIDELS